MTKPIVGQGERQVLASVYSYVLQCNEKNKAASNSADGDKDAKGSELDRAKQSIPK